MKKLSAILLLIIVLTGCSSKPAKIKTEFKAKIKCTYNDINIKADITSANHNIIIRILSPENLNGCVYKYNGSKLTVTYNDLMLNAEKDYLPDDDFANILYNVITTVDKDDITFIQRSDNNARYKGKCDSGEFIISSDYNSGYISKIELKDLNFTSDFKTK